MIVAFDAGMLSILIHPDATIPDDPTTGKPLTSAKERIEQLVESIEAKSGTIIIPTPALSEFLCVVDSAGASYLRVLRTHACFDIQPFDERAAIECAVSQREAFAAGDKKSGAKGSYQKSKVDRQIVSIAKCWQVDRIYTTDNDVVNIANAMKVPATAVWNLPLVSREPEEAVDVLPASATGAEERRAPLLLAAEAAEEVATQPTAPEPSGFSVFVAANDQADVPMIPLSPSEPQRPSGQSPDGELSKASPPAPVLPSVPQADPRPPQQGFSPGAIPPFQSEQ